VLEVCKVAGTKLGQTWKAFRFHGDGHKCCAEERGALTDFGVGVIKIDFNHFCWACK